MQCNLSQKLYNTDLYSVYLYIYIIYILKYIIIRIYLIILWSQFSSNVLLLQFGPITPHLHRLHKLHSLSFLVHRVPPGEKGRNITKLYPLTLHLHHGFCMFLYVFIPDWETFWSNTIATEKRCLFEDGITPHRLNAAGCPHASSAELFPFPFAGPFPFPFAAPLAAGTCHANCNTIPCHSCPLQILLHKLIALPASAASLASSATSAFTSLTSFVSGLAAGTSAAFGSSADGAASRPKQLPSIIKHVVCQASLQ